MPSGDAHRSLARALDILELCSLNGSGYTLTQLSQHLGIAKGSISPLLHTLRDRGYLTLDDQDHHYRIGRMAYLTDFKTIADAEVGKLIGVELLVVNALRFRPHPSHFNVEEALALIARVAPRRALITHVSHEIGRHAATTALLPRGVELAYDGLEIII